MDFKIGILHRLKTEQHRVIYKNLQISYILLEQEIKTAEAKARE